MADHSAMKLGLKPPRAGLKLPTMQHLGVPLPTAAPVMDWGRAIEPSTAWGMDLNDKLGDCTIAAVDHARKLMRVNAGYTFAEPNANELVTAYSGVSGYDQADPSTDSGARWSDVLTFWRRFGFMLGGGRDQISAFVRVNTADENELRLAVQWFGCALVGLALPLSAQTQRVWDVSDGPDGEVGSWGGHAVPIVAYDAGGLSCVTWGALKRMTWPFWRRYASEAYAALSADWIAKSGASPGGIRLDALRGDLAEMARLA